MNRANVIGSGPNGLSAAIVLASTVVGFNLILLVFNLVPATHDVTDEIAAYKLADEPFPGSFGIFYKVHKPTKNTNEAGIVSAAAEKVKGMKDWQILQKNFDRLK